MPSCNATVYAIGDVHGCADELKSLIHKLPLDQNSVLIFLGDYIDRGPNSRAVIDTILDLSSIYNVIALQGNHESLLIQFLSDPKNNTAASNFIFNGGSATLASYSEDGMRFEIPPKHMDFFAKLLPYYSTETHFFVHAGIPPNFDFSDQVDKKILHQFLWIRSAFLNCTKRWSKIIVHGHTPVSTVEVLPNRINLDTGCVFGQQLSAMNISSGQIFSVERNKATKSKFLLSHFNGQERAQRFAGEVAVDLHLDGQTYSYKTINYNEFGLLIFPATGANTVTLQQGQDVEGFIYPSSDSHYEFKAKVVRIEADKNPPAYGLKMEYLSSLK